MQIGFHASHEQIAPSALLRAVCRAEDAGFDAAMCSDHFAPWSARQGHSGAAWSWLGAALHATGLTFGVVTAPGQRYHPAVTAQSIATLAEMFPGRFWAALGSGEAVNEHITGDRWPTKRERDQRLAECVAVIRSLLAGEEVDHRGSIAVDRARLWTRPAAPPTLVGAAVSAATAATVGGWADGLITIDQPPEQLAAVIDAFRSGGGQGKTVAVQVHLSWHRDEGTALAIAHEQWRTNVLAPSLLWNLELVEQFDAAAEHVRPDDLRAHVSIGDLDDHVAHLRAIAALGVDAIYLHHVGQEQDDFIDTFAAHVLPALRS